MRGLIHKVRWLFVAFIVLLTSFFSMTSPVVLGDVFRIDLPQLERSYSYQDWSDYVPVDLGTPLANLASIQLELSGSNSPGWNVGSAENPTYEGPVGGYLGAWMDSASPALSKWSGEYSGQESGGPFTAVLSLQQRFLLPWLDSDWSFLKDGVTDLAISNELILVIGSLTSTPSFELTHVALVIDATPIPEPSTLVLLGAGAASLFAYDWRRRRRIGKCPG